MNDDQKLKSLEERLNKARRNDAPVEEDRNPSQVGMAWRLGMELVVGAVVGVFLGYHIDKWLDTSPIFMIILVLLGFGAGMKNVIASAKEMNKALEDSQND